MKQISLYFSLDDFKESVDSGTILGIPNVLRHGDGWDEKYVYGRIAFTNQSNPSLFSLVSAAGWNKFSSSAITTTELVIRNWLEVRDLFSGGPGISDMSDFKYFTGVSYIPKEMFSGWTSLQTITIPESVTNIEPGAFSSFPVTAEINFAGNPSVITSGLPKNVEIVYYSGASNYEFFNKEVQKNFLDSLDLVWVSGGGITECFIQPDDFKGSFFEQFNQYVSGTDDGRKVRVKYFFKNYVNEIPYASFSGVSCLREVVISTGFTYIGGHSFRCNNLANVCVGDGVKEIGEYAFSGCGYMSSVTLPNSIEIIGPYSFNGCCLASSLADLNWTPEKIREIGNYCFANAKVRNERIVFGENLKKIGDGAFAGYSGSYYTNASSNVKEYDFSNTVLKEIGSNAFAHARKLQSVKLPSETLESIGDCAFYNCNQLYSFTIPGSVTTMSGTNIFYNCHFARDYFVNNSSLNPDDYNYWGATIYEDSLSEGRILVKDNLIVYVKDKGEIVDVVIPDYIVGFSGGTSAASTSMFCWCSNLKTIVLGTGMTYLPISGFCGCTSLTSITIPNSVTGIGNCCFYQCTSLPDVEIPNGVTSLPSSGFSYCNSLTSITIPNSVTGFSYACFWHCTSLTSITIPDSVINFSSYCFYQCTSLASITIPSGITELPYACFNACTSLTSITIPNNVTKLGDYCFYQCSSLANITIPSSITSLPSNCFSYCTSLTSITIPNSVTGFSYACFWHCTSFTSITIPSGVISIGSNCFESCTSLMSITIPSGVTTIGSYCFYNCSSLKNITCNRTTAPSIYSYTFCGVSSNGTLYYPSGSDYSVWLGTSNYYLGKYGWSGQTF